jgi:peptidoglycan/LPS O-acetylase OafA/YrhL
MWKRVRRVFFEGLLRLQPRSLSKGGSAHLDLIRAVTAWLVMWGHLRNLFFVDFERAQQGSRLVKAIYFLTGLGHQSVVVFFVLSGFLISSTVIKRFVSGKSSWRGYAIDRLTRLYVVLNPGLLFGFLWDHAGAVT